MFSSADQSIDFFLKPLIFVVRFNQILANVYKNAISSGVLDILCAKILVWSQVSTLCNAWWLLAQLLMLLILPQKATKPSDFSTSTYDLDVYIKVYLTATRSIAGLFFLHHFSPHKFLV